MTKSIKETQLAQALAKSFTLPSSPTSGLVAYDLSAPAKLIIPTVTPLVNMIPRVSGATGTASNWRTITGYNTSRKSGGVVEGARGASSEHQSGDYTIKYASIGLEDGVTFEADFAAEGFDDVKARAVEGLINSVKVIEEDIDLNGNGSLALGKTPTPAVSSTSTGGSIPSGTYNVIAVALTGRGFNQVKGVVNGMVGSVFSIANATLISQETYTTQDGQTVTENKGVAQQSDATSITVSGSTNKISGSVATVNGAFGYAWFVGTSGNEVLSAVSTNNSFSISSLSASTYNVSNLVNSDCSVNVLEYDGLLTQVSKPGSGAYIKNLDTGTAGTGSSLTSNGSNGINEIDEALYNFYITAKSSPTHIFVGPKTYQIVSKLIIGNNGSPIIRLGSTPESGANNVLGGSRVTSYLNTNTGDTIAIQPHPNMPEGTIFFYTQKVNFNLNNVGSLVDKYLVRDYYQLEWPLRRRTYEYGVYFRGVLRLFFTPAFGLIKNIAI